jgi:hypothetical protein
MTWFRRWLILAHRYLGIGLSLLFAMWFASGIAMIYARGMPQVTADERLKRLSPIDLARVHVSLLDAATVAGVGDNPGRVVLLTIMDRPAYRFTGRGPTTVFADDGQLLGEVGEADALAIASRFANAPRSALRYVRELDEADQWTIGQRGQFPLHKVEVADAAHTDLYVSEATGEVVMKTTRGSRALAWVAAIPHWLYFSRLRLNGELWTRVVVWTSGLATIGALMGLVLAVTQRRVKYTGWMRWHFVSGAVFGVFAATWAFSGLLSMEPFEWFSRASGGGERIPEALSGGPLDPAAFPAIDVERWQQAMAPPAPKEVEFRRIHGDPYYVLRGPGQKPILVSARSLQVRREPFTVDSILARVKEGYPNAPVADAHLLSHYDAYYYNRDREAALPVVRVKFADADSTWVYIDDTSQVVARLIRRQRIERWLYHGLHSLDFPFWYYNRPLWDIGVIALLAGGTTLSTVGVVIGYKRVRRAVGRALSHPAKT